MSHSKLDRGEKETEMPLSNTDPQRPELLGWMERFKRGQKNDIIHVQEILKEKYEAGYMNRLIEEMKCYAENFWQWECILWLSYHTGSTEHTRVAAHKMLEFESLSRHQQTHESLLLIHENENFRAISDLITETKSKIYARALAVHTRNTKDPLRIIDPQNEYVDTRDWESIFWMAREDENNDMVHFALDRLGEFCQFSEDADDCLELIDLLHKANMTETRSDLYLIVQERLSILGTNKE